MSIFTCGTGCRAKTDAFVSQYGTSIANAIADTGLFFSAVVAQNIVESGYGESELAAKYNNLGGVKALSGFPSVSLDTTEVVSGRTVAKKQSFAVFPNADEYFKQYVKNLQSPTLNYTSMGVFDASTPEEQIQLMAQAGYTTKTPDDYLGSMDGILDYVRLKYGLGKIVTKQPEMTTPQLLNTLGYNPIQQ